MFKLAKGWTKKKVMEQVKKYNNNTRAVSDPSNPNAGCQYLSPNGNHCAIGCFLPKKSKVLSLDEANAHGSVEYLIEYEPHVMRYMPFDDLSALIAFQQVHDDADDNEDGNRVYDRVAKFLKTKVK